MAATAALPQAAAPTLPLLLPLLKLWQQQCCTPTLPLLQGSVTPLPPTLASSSITVTVIAAIVVVVAFSLSTAHPLCLQPCHLDRAGVHHHRHLIHRLHCLGDEIASPLCNIVAVAIVVEVKEDEHVVPLSYVAQGNHHGLVGDM